MLEQIQPQEFAQVFSMMENSFPIDEYRTYEEQKALLTDPAYNLYATYHPQTNHIKAWIAIWQLESFSFIEHFAVNQNERNQGLGTAILKEVKQFLPHQICLEVEPPIDDLTQRRIQFYQRNGFSLNNYPYTQPPISKGKQPIPLILMTTGGCLSVRRFEEIKTVIYNRVYHTLEESLPNDQ